MTETADQHISAIQSSNYEQIQEDQHSNNFEDFQVEKKVFNITENMNFISIFRWLGLQYGSMCKQNDACTICNNYLLFKT